jgi:TPR repeat protein
MRSTSESLRACLSSFLILGFLLFPEQTLASGADARRAYIARNYQLAHQLAEPLAERGDSTAMLVLGMLYFGGKSVSRDYKTALSWWRAAAEAGNNRARNNIGYIFLQGLGVQQNYHEAAKWFEASASNKDAYAYRNLGRMYEEGRGFPFDLQKALEMYKQSATLYKEELINDPDNKDVITSEIAFVSQRISILSAILDRSGPVSAPVTPQSNSGSQTTPK